MNEIRDIIVGIDFGREYSQICYYDRKGDEARSLSMKVGGSQDEAPSCLCWRPEQKDYCVGLEAEYFVREKGGQISAKDCRFRNFKRKCIRRKMCWNMSIISGNRGRITA